MIEVEEVKLKPSAGQAALYYGLIFAAGMIISHLIMYLADIKNESIAFGVFIVLMAVGIILASLNYRNKKWKGFISYGKAVKIGFLTVLFGAILVTPYTIVFNAYVDKSQIVEQRIEAKSSLDAQFPNAKTDPEQKKQRAVAEKWIDYMVSPVSYGVFGLLAYAFFGIIISLLTSIFIKRDENVRLN